MCTLPNFGRPGEALGAGSLLHDTGKFIQRRNCIPAVTQLQKLVVKFPLRPVLPVPKLLERNGQNWEEK